jgi:hypothetical protein
MDLVHLCDYCAKVPLDDDSLGRANGDDVENLRYNLGSWNRINASQCPLCRIVKLTCYEDYRTRTSQHVSVPKEDIWLLWGNTLGPGARGAFKIVGLQPRICFARMPTTPKPQRDRCFLRPVVQSNLEVSQITLWLLACETTHSEDCALSPAAFSEAFPGLDKIRLIDVEQGCLVEFKDHCPYIALSYVWGTVSGFRLTTSNRSKLSVPGGVTDAWDMLPRTIVDAITLCRKLNCRYLWVDALCLVQNDARELEQGINVMDQIYERSRLTIVAACGHDANAGLPGVRDGSRKDTVIATQVIPGTHLGLYLGLDRLLDRSVYYSRAWTWVLISPYLLLRLT